MLHSVHIALDVHDPFLRKSLSEEFVNQPDISLASKRRSVEPNVFFLDDAFDPGTVLEKIRALRQEYPKVGIFVISSDPSPDHIVEIMKAGANEFFLNPINPQKIREAIDRIHQQLVEGAKGTTGKAFAFLGSKGGLGTTVLTVNIATALSGRKSGQCTLLDLNLQAGDSSVLLDVVPSATMTEVIRNFNRLDAAFLAGVMEKTTAGFDLLAAPASPEDSSEVTAEHVGRVLQLCRNQYEMTIIDCPAMDVDERALEGLRGADTTFLVTDLSVPAVRNASRLLKLLRKSGIGRTEVVVNRYLKGQTATIDEVEKTLGCRIFWLFPNDFESTMASINRGTPLMKYDPRSVLARNITEFIQKLQDPAAFPQYRGAKGLLGKAV